MKPNLYSIPIQHAPTDQHTSTKLVARNVFLGGEGVLPTP